MRAIAVLLILAIPAPSFAYLKLGTIVNGRIVDATWREPVRYFINLRDGNGVTSADLTVAVSRAAATWQQVPSASVRFEFQGITAAVPGAVDSRTTLGFVDRPDLDRVLGATSFLIDSTNGAIVEADIFFNTQFAWSMSPVGDSGRVDLESVALHELGHLLGLSHSALGETERTANGGRRVTASGSIMFPIAMTPGAIADRVLQADDIAGISDLYPVTSITDGMGAITGRVTKNGQGVMGAHVIALNPETGKVIANFSLSANGDFVIAKLEPGPYVLRVEPLDDAEVESFFSGPIDIDFRVAYAPRMVVAPQSGSSAPIEIGVLPK